MEGLASALIYYVIFLFSTTLHEAAHAWAAMRGGDLTAYRGGQVTLDPLPHIRREPWGMVVLPVITVLISGWPFGFASAPYDPNWALRHPRRAAWMALAGPAANLALVLVAGALLRLFGALDLLYPPQSITFDHLAATDAGGVWPTIAFFLSVLFSLNLVLFCLNLIPLPPLDGASVLPLFLDEHASRRYQEFLLGTGRAFSFIGIYVAWQLFDVLFDPVWLIMANLLYPGAHYG